MTHNNSLASFVVLCRIQSKTHIADFDLALCIACIVSFCFFHLFDVQYFID